MMRSDTVSDNEQEGAVAYVPEDVRSRAYCDSEIEDFMAKLPCLRTTTAPLIRSKILIDMKKLLMTKHSTASTTFVWSNALIHILYIHHSPALPKKRTVKRKTGGSIG